MTNLIRSIATRYLYTNHKTPTRIFLVCLFSVLFIITALIFFVWAPHNLMFGGFLIFLFLFLCITALSLISSIFNVIAMMGISLGVASLFVVVALISGYYHEVQEKLIGFQAHLSVKENQKLGYDFNSILPIILKQPHVMAASPTLYPQMFVSKPGFPAMGVLIKGVEVSQASKVLNINNWLLPENDTVISIHMLSQLITPKNSHLALPTAFIGEGIAKKLKIKVGDVISLKGIISSTNQSAARQFFVAALLRSGFEEYDQRVIYISLKEATTLTSIGPAPQIIEVRLDDLKQTQIVAKQLAAILSDYQIDISTWQDNNSSLFKALETQKTILSLIMFLIILVASFNMIAGLTMIVTDKVKEIAILKAMGITTRGIASIFRFMGLNLCLLGTSVGILLGLLISITIQKISYSLPSEIYKINNLSIKPPIMDVLIICISTMLLCLLATLYPASKAAKMAPTEGLHYE